MRRFIFSTLVLGLLAFTALLAVGPVAAQGNVTGVVTANALNVRAGPGVSNAPVGLLHQGDSVTILEQQNGWYHVRFAGGEGWVSGAYVQRGGQTAPAVRSVAGLGPDRLVFQQASGGPIYTVNLDGSNLRQVGAGIDPSWSPYGRQITYVSWNEPRGVYVMNADGSNKHRIFDSPEPRAPRWSPDGTAIVFSRRLEAVGDHEACVTVGVPGVFTRKICFDAPPDEIDFLGLVTLADGSFRDLPTWPHAKTPVWRPDNDHIIYADEKGLHQTDRAGTLGFDPHLPEINAVTLDTSDTDPDLSPDGRYLVTTYHQHDHWEIHRVDLQTGERRRLTQSGLLERPANNVSPTWSPNGKQILFVSDRDGAWGFYLMNADGSNQHPVLQNVTARVPLRYDFAAEQVVDWTR
ncbi:MAG: SH3 domain-containing protein [Ardenticatenaceae bacterium]|nr:SH3 domain-containing protein [Ardenticatenaceae bacterium]HBY98655.1 hypothetical protein [Chloroflexota bacterium]